MDVASFRARFPEFRNAPDALVNDAIVRAEISCLADRWGELQDEGVGALAAHLLALSPYGQHARLSADDTRTTYGERYEALRAEVAATWLR